MLEYVNAVGKSVGSVIGANFATGLEDDFATIYLFINVVYGYTALGVTGSEYGFVYVMAVHTRAAM